MGYYQPLLKGRTFRNRFLLAASLVFYAWGEPVFVFIMCAGILVNWVLALRMSGQTGGSRKRTLGLAIGGPNCRTSTHTRTFPGSPCGR
jgi:D-alanyl-lipoteichoic acid acyltransferase DltB (MBOAT superfamily)